ncbi:MAG TPA: CHAT domain-containing protein [Thermoanaerobaculia bacterium]|nr:CHAT domain-containing protein [Thermoanaerobaculia bacterium]
MSPEPAQTILFLSAAPEGTQRLRFDQEIRDLREGLRLAEHRDRFTIAERHASRARDLHRAVLELHPRIVHFSGHGSERGEILLERDDGTLQRVRGEALAALFQLFQDDLDCVILNACSTENQAKEIARSIPFVIGMRREVEDRAAIHFVSGFYDALADGCDYSAAFEHGKTRLLLEGNFDGHTVPILLQGPPLRPRKKSGHSQQSPDPTTYAQIEGLSPAEIQAVIRQYKALIDAGREDADVHHAMGLLFLEIRMYDAAIKHLERALALAPDAAGFYYHLALGLLRGRRPRVLARAEVKKIEEQLAASLAFDDGASLPRYLLAYVRRDYYLGNGMTEPRPDHRELLGVALRLPTDPWEARRLLRSAEIGDAQIHTLIEQQTR